MNTRIKLTIPSDEVPKFIGENFGNYFMKLYYKEVTEWLSDDPELKISKNPTVKELVNIFNTYNLWDEYFYDYVYQYGNHFDILYNILRESNNVSAGDFLDSHLNGDSEVVELMHTEPESREEAKQLTIRYIKQYKISSEELMEELL